MSERVKAMTAVRGQNATDGRPVAIQEYSLCLQQEYRFLGTSRDQVVYDKSTVDCFSLMEIKSPHKAFTLGKIVREACDNAHFCCKLTDGQPHCSCMRCTNSCLMIRFFECS